MAAFGRYVSDFVKTTISTISPYKVEDISISNVEEYRKNYSLIDFYEDTFQLFKIANYYEAVYVSCKNISNVNAKAFSLFRYQGTIVDAKKMHKRYYEILNLFDRSICDKLDKNLLDKICNNIKIHEFWTAAHIASFLELEESFRSGVLNNIINNQDQSTGVTPLHLAVTSGNINLVKEILLIDSIDVNILNKEDNSVLHLAASHENYHILNLLLNKSQDSVNSLNKFGRSPLHIACEAKSKDCLGILLRSGADPSINKNPEYPIHVAMRVDSIECLTLLCEYFPEHINCKHLETGQTAIHLVKSKPMLKRLHKLGANLDVQDNDGKTLLQNMVIENKFEMVFELLLYMVDPNIVDKRKKSALHFAMKDCDLDTIRALIVYEIDLNLLDSNGNTARHILCQNDNKKYQHSKTKDIILYTLNAVGAARCETNKTNCSEGCSIDGKFDGKPPTPVLYSVDHIKDMMDETLLRLDQQSKISKSRSSSSLMSNDGHQEKQADIDNEEIDWYYLNRSDNETSYVKPSGLRVLSLDGGGIRGLILVQTLRALERISNRPIVDMFDWIVGTSTGGLLAISIVYKISLKECRNMYMRIKDEVFVGKRPYNADYLEKVVKEHVGEKTTMTCVTYPKLTVTSLLCDRFPPKLHLFRNYDPPLSTFKSKLMQKQKPDDNPKNESPKIQSFGTHDPTVYATSIKPPSQQLVWEVAKATGAAPTFFRACGPYVDGGLISNNPTVDILTEITEYNMIKKKSGEAEEPIGIVVSVGTGRVPIIPISSVDVFRPNNPLDVYNIVQGVSVLTKVIVEMATATEGRLVDRARAWCHSIEVPFFRFSPPLSQDIPLDSTDNKIILEMLWDTEAYLYRSTDRLKLLTTLL